MEPFERRPAGEQRAHYHKRNQPDEWQARPPLTRAIPSTISHSNLPSPY